MDVVIEGWVVQRPSTPEIGVGTLGLLVRRPSRLGVGEFHPSTGGAGILVGILGGWKCLLGDSAMIPDMFARFFLATAFIWSTAWQLVSMLAEYRVVFAAQEYLLFARYRDMPSATSNGFKAYIRFV